MMVSDSVLVNQVMNTTHNLIYVFNNALTLVNTSSITWALIVQHTVNLVLSDPHVLNVLVMQLEE
jgi:hypothetical protein